MAQLIAALLILSAVAATAKPPPAPPPPTARVSGVCEGLNQNISRLERELSAGGADARGSAQDLAAFAEIQTNLLQLFSNRCDPYPYVINSEAFSRAAEVCRAALQSARNGRSGVTEADGQAMKTSCDRSLWTRDR